MSSNGRGKQSLNIWLDGVTGWIDLVDEDKKRMGGHNGFCVEIGWRSQAVMAHCAVKSGIEG